MEIGDRVEDLISRIAVSCGEGVFERGAADVHEPIVVEEHPRVGDQRIRREEGS